MANDNLFDDKNQLKSAYISWGKPGDYFAGTLMGKRQMENKLKNPPEMQTVYEFKCSEGRFFTLDGNKNPVADATVIKEGDVYNVGGKKAIDAQMRNVKIGQVVGMKFIEETPAKTKGFNATKVIRVYSSGAMDPTFMSDVGESLMDDSE